MRMTRLYLANFGLLPILAKSFWNIARYSSEYPYKNDFYNKRLSLVTKDISFYCIFSKKYCLTDKFESNKNINSNLIIMSKNYRIKEFCNYSYYDRSKYLDLEYSLKTISPELNLKDKVNLSYELIDKLEISNNFYSSLLPKTQELLIDVNQIIEENKDKIEVE
jgi:hypothetical protein